MRVNSERIVYQKVLANSEQFYKTRIEMRLRSCLYTGEPGT